MDNQSNTNPSQESRQTTDSTTTPQTSTREPMPAPKPSQAEGDRDTIEQDIRQKESTGEL